MHTSILILLSFRTLFIHIRPWIAAQQSIKKTCQNFVSMFASFAVHGGICGSFHNKATIHHPHCVVYYDKTWTNTVLTCFTKMIVEQPSLTEYGRPMYHMYENTNMLSSTDKNFMIFLFDFERFRNESPFPFF